MDTNTKGDWAELKATTWLMEQGYQVFRNVSCVGPADLIAWKDDELIKIDVKCGSKSIRKFDNTVVVNYPKSRPTHPDVTVLVMLPDGEFLWAEQVNSINADRPNNCADKVPKVSARARGIISKIDAN